MNIDSELDKMACQFFRLFSRAEYALKMAGFYTNSTYLQPDWTRFASTVDTIITSPPSDELEAAVSFIVNAPPMKQVVRNNRLEWEPAPVSTACLADEVLVYIRRVRNNLFHGGKFNGRWFAPERSEPLIQHSMTILSACIAENPATRSAFEQH